MDRLTASELASRLDAQNSTVNINLTQMPKRGTQNAEKLDEKKKQKKNNGIKKQGSCCFESLLIC